MAKISKQDQRLIERIVDRAITTLDLVDHPAIFRDLACDLTVVHLNYKLRLDALLKADNFNFCHDISGIRAKLDRKTGKLVECFRPRFATK